MDASEKVLDVLKSADKPMKSSELALESGLDKKDVDKAIKKLKKEGIINSPKACYYSIVKE